MSNIGVSLPGFTGSTSLNEKTEQYDSITHLSLLMILPQDFETYQNCLEGCNVGYHLCMGHIHADPPTCAQNVKACRRHCEERCFSEDFPTQCFPT